MEDARRKHVFVLKKGVRTLRPFCKAAAALSLEMPNTRELPDLFIGHSPLFQLAAMSDDALALILQHDGGYPTSQLDVSHLVA